MLYQNPSVMVPSSSNNNNNNLEKK
jgi:hypothetical protein